MELIRLGKLGRGAPAVVPGPDPVASEGSGCRLCGDGGRLTWAVVGHVDTMVCVDSHGCVRRALGVRS